MPHRLILRCFHLRSTTLVLPAAAAVDSNQAHDQRYHTNTEQGICRSHALLMVYTTWFIVTLAMLDLHTHNTHALTPLCALEDLHLQHPEHKTS
jgi:hypothetical protein